MAHSSAARAAVENLTRVLSIEWARFGIRLVALAAGHVRDGDDAHQVSAGRWSTASAGTMPLGRLGTEEEFAWLVAYLASPAGDFVSGHGAHDRRRARQLVRLLAAGGDHERGREAAGRGAAAEAVSEVPELRTERLLMRGFRDDDYERWTEVPATRTCRRGLGQPEGVTPREAWLDMAVLGGHWTLRGYGHWVLEERGTGELVGRPGSTTRRTGRRSRSGWAVAPRALGQGLRARGGASRLRVGPRRLGAGHIVSLIDPSTRSSIRVAEKLGETLEGTGYRRPREFDLLVYGADLPLDAPN